MNGHGQKEYGEHKYADHDGTSDCEYGCGCWMGPSRSGGPTGLDPFGKCPKNPNDGKLLGGTADYDYIVNNRINALASCLARAEGRLSRVSPDKQELANELAAVKAKLEKYEQILNKIHSLID